LQLTSSVSSSSKILRVDETLPTSGTLLAEQAMDAVSLLVALMSQTANHTVRKLTPTLFMKNTMWAQPRWPIRLRMEMF